MYCICMAEARVINKVSRFSSCSIFSYVPTLLYNNNLVSFSEGIINYQEKQTLGPSSSAIDSAKKKNKGGFDYYMCLPTVAHQGGSGEFTRFTAEHGGDEEAEATFRQGGGGSGTSSSSSIGPPPQPQPLGFGEPSGGVAMQGGELTGMVSELTQLVSGHAANTQWWGHQGSGFPPMSGSVPFPSYSSPHDLSSSSGALLGSPSAASGSPSWVGHKRGREQEASGSGASSHELVQDVSRLYGTIGDFRVPSSQGQGESSSGAIGLLSLNTNSLSHIIIYIYVISLSSNLVTINKWGAIIYFLHCFKFCLNQSFY